jgi:hypothetical protein
MRLVEFLVPDPEVNRYGLASGENISTIRTSSKATRGEEASLPFQETLLTPVKTVDSRD